MASVDPMERCYRVLRRLKNRIYRLAPRCVELFAELVKTPTPTGLVFDHSWKDWRSIFGAYRRLIRAAGLPYVRGRSGPKKMRCTVYTMIELAGGDASKFARHSDRRVTDVYLDRVLLAAQNTGIWPPPELNPENPSKKWWRVFG